MSDAVSESSSTCMEGCADERMFAGKKVGETIKTNEAWVEDMEHMPGVRRRLIRTSALRRCLGWSSKESGLDGEHGR